MELSSSMGDKYNKEHIKYISDGAMEKSIERF